MLAEHDVRPEDFLQFMDHLNVCKSASPPFQVLNLAGMVLGFTYVLVPVPSPYPRLLRSSRYFYCWSDVH